MPVGVRAGIKRLVGYTTRYLQILDPLEFLTEFRPHILPQGMHLIRCYDWCSNKARGLRRKVAEAATAGPLRTSANPAAELAPALRRASPT